MSKPTEASKHHSVNPIRSVLVANRGEIALRIFATARSMGLRCIAVYVDADTDAAFVREADEAYRLPSTYLDGPAVIAAAVSAGANAIHPGYGFLSENANFATAVSEAGMVWVGPAPQVIETMGDKIAAKRAAVKAGIPTLPSSETCTASDAETVGYPVLVKAAAGGGGKGMRVVATPEELTTSIEAAQREALNGFGDDRVFLEHFVGQARHVEIQILGDEHGNVIHLGERECSIQRRHQKIIEESPSPVVDQDLRAEMGRAAVSLAKSLDYSSTGTVEFLVDDQSKEFFFLEVNTRLQVEHPVTEAVTGIDLVREQFRVANGLPLAHEQTDITQTGAAIEVRLYAEDPATNFLPQAGTLGAFEPAPTPAIRWDMGIEAGDTVSVNFDPMLGKLIAHAETRTEAAGQLALALERLHLGGVTTNRDYLAAALRSSEFLAGDTTTDFVDRVDLSQPASTEQDQRFAAIAAALWLQANNRASAEVLGGIRSGWRNSRMPAEQRIFQCDGYQSTDADDSDSGLIVSYRATRDGSFDLGDQGRALVHHADDRHIDIAINDRRQYVRITQCGESLFVQSPQTTITLRLQPRFAPPADDGPTGGLVAPMPGSVLEVFVAPGDTVVAGQQLLILEAMKMEHPITAPAAGEIAEVRVTSGEQVQLGHVLVVMADE